MKKALLIIAAAFALTLASARATTVTLNLLVAQLLTSGSAAIPDGSLVQLIAGTSSSFASPTATSFTGGDSSEVVLASFLENSASAFGEPGGFQDTLGLTLTGNGSAPDSGSFLMLRWFPTITGTSTAVGPGGGTTYGQFRTNAVENGSSIAWVLPASGNVSLNFETAAVGGSEANSAGVANLVVPVPEPATPPFLIGAFALAALVWRKTRQTRQ